MLRPALAEDLRDTASLRLEIAAGDEQIREAQRLRYRVFHREVGRSFGGSAESLDRDGLDLSCVHLLVRELAGGEVVATARLLRSTAAGRAAGFDSERTFDLTPIRRRRPRLLEVGRVCVAPSHRSGEALALLWSGMTRFLRGSAPVTLLGRVSIPLAAGVAAVRRLVVELAERSGLPACCRASAHLPLPNMIQAARRPCPTPPLLVLCLRLGARLASDAAWDRRSRTAELLLLLDVEPAHRPSLRRLVGRAAAP